VEAFFRFNKMKVSFPRPGVDFANVLQAAFERKDPKSAKRHWQLDCFWESLPVKALRKHVGEIYPRRQSYKKFVFKKSKLVLKSLTVRYLNLDHDYTVVKSKLK